MREVEQFCTLITHAGWHFPTRPLTEWSRQRINSSARCPHCRGRVTLEVTTCGCGKRLARNHRYFGQLAYLRVPEKVRWEVQYRQNRRFRNWRRSTVRRVLLSQAEGHHNCKDIFRLWGAQGGRCYYCDAPFSNDSSPGKYSVDHVIPVSQGGANWPGNLVLACPFCNGSKGVRNERETWQCHAAFKGEAWVSMRRKSLVTFRHARAAIDQERREAEARASRPRPP